MQFGFERFSNVGELEFWLHVRPGRHMRWLHLPPTPPPPHQVWKELHFWCCISVSNTAPAASVQSDTSNRHFEAEQSRTVSTTSSCPHERENVRFVHHKQRLRMCYIFCFFFFFFKWSRNLCSSLQSQLINMCDSAYVHKCTNTDLIPYCSTSIAFIIFFLVASTLWTQVDFVQCYKSICMHYTIFSYGWPIKPTQTK